MRAVPLPLVSVPVEAPASADTTSTVAAASGSRWSWIKAMLRFAGMSDPWFLRLFQVTSRRRGWLVEGLTARKAWNLALGAFDYVLKRERVASMPVMVKVDISPQCALKCTACVHSDTSDNELLKRQEFNSRQRMSLDDFSKIIGQLKGRTSAVSLYYLGDPYMHPQHDEMCRIARDAGLNVHSSTHFSYAFTEERIRRIVNSGLTHLTVCVDGLTQENYGRTRVGGQIDLVLKNLRRLLEIRREIGSVYPRVEVQYLKFDYNLHEMETARKMLTEWGVDHFEEMWGLIGNFTDTDPGRIPLEGPKKGKALPMCFWPYSGMVVKWNGDVLPCCNFRHGEQYARDGETRAVGNVLKDGVEAVWNSPGYQAIRRSVNSPQKYDSEPELQNNYCHSCPALFNTPLGFNDSGTNHQTHEPKFVSLTVGGKTSANAA